jgi:hypothetical protein
VPSRKQRRKREKLQRHEYEYVIETEDGEEVVEGPRVAEARSAAANGKSEKEPMGLVDRRGRPIQKPSLQRVLKRTAIFAPLIALFIVLTADGLTVGGLLFHVLILLAFFMPFSYMVDTFVYRMLLRRHERDRAARKAR